MRIYSRFPKKEEKNYETVPLPRDEARFPCVGAEQFHVAIKHERSLDFLDGTLDSPQENYHMYRGTLRSP